MKVEATQIELERFQMSIGGEAVSADSWLDVVDPNTGRPWAQVPNATKDHVDCAVAAANAAFTEWSEWTLDSRCATIEKFLVAIEARADEFARILYHERGGPLQGGLGEVRSAVSFSRALLSQYPASQPVQTDSNLTITQIRKPLGVIGAIAPWNFPLQLVLVKIVPALLCGNAIVVKPSPFTPVTASLLGEIARELLPSGLVNVITGGDHLGPAVTRHPGIAKISFTGSTDTGRRVLAAAAQTLKRVTLELGGNDAAIVTADADPVAAANALGWLAFANNGQICLAVKRIYVHESVYQSFCDRLVILANAVKVGPAMDETADNGPIQNASQFARVRDLLEDAIEKGGKVIAGGNVPLETGYFLRPTVVAEATEDMRLVSEEQFGPVTPIIRFSDLDEAIDRANDCEYGLGSSVWSSDLEAARLISRRLKAGVTWINQHGYPDPRMPLAGSKQSGIGVEFGEEGVLEYTRLQVESVSAGPANWFVPDQAPLDEAGAKAGTDFLDRISGVGKAAAASIQVIDPANEEPIAICAVTDPADLESTIVRAHQASEKWRQLAPDVRHRHLISIAGELLANREELAWLLVREQGKSLTRARGEIELAAQFVGKIADQAKMALAAHTIALGNNRTARVEYEPLGVTAAIAPWNAPIALGFVKIATAIAAGNTVVLKPSPNTPLTTTRAIEIITPCLPDFVVQIVNGGAEIGEALVTHPLVRKVSFTGSTNTGRRIREITAPQLKRLTLELGGNDAAIVLDDGDPAQIATSIAALAFGNSGQICAAIKRIYVARPLHDDFVTALIAAAQSFNVGPGLDPGIDLGPIQNTAQFERVCALWRSALECGGRSLCGGPRKGKGYFFDPSVVVDVAEGCSLVDEEQFGPVVPVMAFDTVEEAIARSNATLFGLGAGVWSKDLGAARLVAGRLEAGTVWINQHGRFDPGVPMPLIKESGIGIDYAEHGLREQTQIHAFVSSA